MAVARAPIILPLPRPQRWGPHPGRYRRHGLRRSPCCCISASQRYPHRSLANIAITWVLC